MRKNSSSGVDICHNVQVAVEGENHLIVAVDVSSQAIDREQLVPISCQAKENLGVPNLTVVADRGYYSGKQFAKCSELGIVPIVSKPIATRAGISDAYGKGAFRYDEQLGGYVCPQGNLLTAYRSRPSSKYKDYTRYANEKACAECPVRNQCSDSKHGRTICDQPYEVYLREVDQRTKANMDIYRKRQQLVEHPFGTVKRALGFTYFLTVGTENVRTESILHFLAYNLRRVINMLKMRKMAQGTQG